MNVTAKTVSKMLTHLRECNAEGMIPFALTVDIKFRSHCGHCVMVMKFTKTGEYVIFASRDGVNWREAVVTRKSLSFCNFNQQSLNLAAEGYEVAVDALVAVE